MELVEEIKNRLQKQNQIPDDKNEGSHKIVKPFMEQNGFRNGNGWWIKSSTN